MSVAVFVSCSSCQKHEQAQEQEQVQEQAQEEAHVATSFWQIVNPHYSDTPGYRVLYEGQKERHCIPVTGAFEPAWDPQYDTYHMFHHHGVAVESELMAYRIYFDKKQTIDVYCKRTPRLELAQSYWYPNDSLLAEHYGDDILRVGGTVGVGTVKYWNNKLYHIENAGERQQWIEQQTADTAVIGVGDIDWEVPDGKLEKTGERTMTNLRAYYTMCAGHRDMRCDVQVNEPINGLCTGVQLIPNKGKANWWKEDFSAYALIEESEAGVLLGSWGTDWPVNDTVKYAKETVGLGVFIPKPYTGKTVQDKSNNLCLLKLSEVSDENSVSQYTAHFYLTCCGATKEDHPVATNATEWYNYLRSWAETLE